MTAEEGLRYSCWHNMFGVVWLWISALDLRRAGTPGTNAGQIFSVEQK